MSSAAEEIMAKCRRLRGRSNVSAHAAFPLIQDLAALVAILYSQADAAQDSSEFRGGDASGGKEEEADDDVEDVRAPDAGSGEPGASGLADGAAKLDSSSRGLATPVPARADNVATEGQLASAAAAAAQKKSCRGAAPTPGPQAASGVPPPPSPEPEVVAPQLALEIAQLQEQRVQAEKEVQEALEMKQELRQELSASAEKELMARAESMTTHQMALLRSAWKAERAAQLAGQPGTN